MKPEKLRAIRNKLNEDFDKYMNDPEVEEKYKSAMFFLDNRYEVRQGMTYGDVVNQYFSFINEKWGWDFYSGYDNENRVGTKFLHNWLTGQIKVVPAEVLEFKPEFDEEEEYEN